MIVVDSCRVNYQVFLITYLKWTIRIAKHAWREKGSDQNVSLLGLKIIDWITEIKKYNGISTRSINELIEKFPNTYQFCNGDLNKFVLLLRKVVYPYVYMDS